jgi:hypothetical protein
MVPAQPGIVGRQLAIDLHDEGHARGVCGFEHQQHIHISYGFVVEPIDGQVEHWIVDEVPLESAGRRYKPGQVGGLIDVEGDLVRVELDQHQPPAIVDGVVERIPRPDRVVLVDVVVIDGL